MADLTKLCTDLQNLFGEVAQRVAFQSGFRQRVSKLGGAEVAQALVGGWLDNPKASRADLAQLVGVSKEALDQCLTKTGATFLKGLLSWAIQRLAGQQVGGVELLSRFTGVYVMDSSSLSLPAELAELWPGCGKAGSLNEAGLKLHVVLDLVSGTLYGPELTPARTHDRSGPHQGMELPAGTLRLADLGYFKLARFKEIAAQQAFFLTKVQTGLHVYVEDEQTQPLSAWLAAQKQSSLDCEVVVGVAERLKCRLLAWQVPQTVVEKRQAGFKAQETKRQRPVSAEQQALSYWTVYLTNVPADQLSPHEAGVLYRLRWQIELLFKLWKSGGNGLEQWCSKKPWALMSEIYAKLIGVVVQHWVLLVGIWHEPERSLIKASRVVRGHIRSVLARLGEPAALEDELGRVVVSLGQGGRLDRHKLKPSSFQLLINLPLLDSA